MLKTSNEAARYGRPYGVSDILAGLGCAKPAS